MTKKLVLSVAMLAVGAGLLVAASATAGSAGSAAAEAAKGPQGKSSVNARGGTLRVNLATDTDYVDPALAYYQISWEMEYATCAKLLNYPDREAPAGSRLSPDAATGLPAVSGNGRVYTFTVKRGIKSNLGTELTAANFAAAINRDLNPKMQSPAGPFIADIVGAQAVLDGKAAKASGVKTPSKYKLQIRLAQPAPDLLARIAMPFFCAIPTNLPIIPEGVNALESWGPYYVAARTPNRSITLNRNPNYKGPRPANPDQIVYNVGVNPDASLLQIERGQADYASDGLNPTAYADIAAKYGINRSRFFVKPSLNFRYLALNNDRPLFKGNVALRRAISYAIDRPALLRQYGAFAGERATHYLPPGMPGYVKQQVYPIRRADYDTAKKLAEGKTGSGKAVMYTCNKGACLTTAQVLQFNFQQIGIDVEVQKFARAVQFEKGGIRGEPFDVTFEGWVADYADPFDFINILLDGTTIRPVNNVNFSYFNSPEYNKKMEDAAKLTGAERFSTYGKLDLEIAAKQAPLASFMYENERHFVSKRVKNYIFNPVYGTDLAAISLS
jgi:peptide/nickel transport system substrate-binding protein